MGVLLEKTVEKCDGVWCHITFRQANISQAQIKKANLTPDNFQAQPMFFWQYSNLSLQIENYETAQ
jgi:hypothetical protein